MRLTFCRREPLSVFDTPSRNTKLVNCNWRHSFPQYHEFSNMFSRKIKVQLRPLVLQPVSGNDNFQLHWIQIKHLYIVVVENAKYNWWIWSWTFIAFIVVTCRNQSRAASKSTIGWLLWVFQFVWDQTVTTRVDFQRTIPWMQSLYSLQQQSAELEHCWKCFLR